MLLGVLMDQVQKLRRCWHYGGSCNPLDNSEKTKFEVISLLEPAVSSFILPTPPVDFYTHDLFSFLFLNQIIVILTFFFFLNLFPFLQHTTVRDPSSQTSKVKFYPKTIYTLFVVTFSCSYFSFSVNFSVKRWNMTISLVNSFPYFTDILLTFFLSSTQFFFFSFIHIPNYSSCCT